MAGVVGASPSHFRMSRRLLKELGICSDAGVRNFAGVVHKSRVARVTRLSGSQWCGTVEPPTTVGKVDDDMDATNETGLATGAPVQGSAPAELPFADDAIRVLRAAVKRARSEARARGITRGQVPVSVGHLADALTRSEASTSSRKVSVVGDRRVAWIMGRAETLARIEGATAISAAHLSLACEAGLRRSGLSLARLGYARFRASTLAVSAGLDPAGLAWRTGDGEVVVAGLVPASTDLA